MPAHVTHIGDPGYHWTASSAPAANTQATATHAAYTNLRHVVTGFSVAFVAGAVAPTAVALTVRLIDGDTGGTTYLWQSAYSIPAVAGARTGDRCEDEWFGSVGSAVTLEFSTAGGANTIESVSMEGYAVP